MDNILDILFLKHNMWLDYIKSFGCDEEIAEDFVQEMYIKIYNYSLKKDSKQIMFNDNEVNHYFIYTCLKNMYTDSIRRTKNIKFERITDYEDGIEYDETLYNIKLSVVNKWQSNIANEIESIKGNTRRKTNLSYLNFVYQKVFVEQMSISEFSREVGITYWSLRNTVLLIKDLIKDENKSI